VFYQFSNKLNKFPFCLSLCLSGVGERRFEFNKEKNMKDRGRRSCRPMFADLAYCEGASA